MKMRWGAVTVVVLSLAGCSSTAPAVNGKLNVAVTVAPITDIVRQVVGDRVNLSGLIPEGVDSHTFEPSPSTVKTLARADILFMDGLHLEGSTLKQAQANMRAPIHEGTDLGPDAKGSEIVLLGDLTVKPSEYAYDFTFPKSAGDPNPHLWMNPIYALRWSEIVRDTMVARDPVGAEYYRANQKRFAAVIATLDTAIAAAVGSIPESHKKLLTYHDSFAYFSKRYGIAVLGAVQPSDFSEPSPQEIKRLVDQVKALNVPAIFGSEVFPSKVLAEVAREGHARYIDKLRDDELPGDPGARNHTYIGLLVDDVTIITQALGGDASPLSSVPTEPTWQTSS